MTRTRKPSIGNAPAHRPGRGITVPQKLTYTPTGVVSSIGYHSARVMRAVDGRNPTRASGQWHEQSDRARLVNQSREFMRDNLLYGGLIGRCLDFAVGRGFDLIAADKTVDMLWDEWLQDADISGRYNGDNLARTVAKEYLTTGEGIALKVNGGQIQIIESEQIQPWNGARQGVATDRYGRPTKFYIGAYKDGMLQQPKPVAANNVLFVCERERPSSQRGVPVLQTAFPMLHRINDVLDSEALAWQLVSRIALKHTSASGAPLPSVTNDGVNVVEVPYGLIFEAGVDDELVSMDRNIPGKDFPQSVTTFCRFLGLPLGIPLELVLLDWTKSNFSQMRGALLLAWKSFRHIQSTLVNYFYEPLFRWKVGQWIAQGLVPDAPESYEHEWVLPQFPWVDQMAEANAQEKKLSLGLTTYAEACKSLERDAESITATRKQEIVRAIETAKEVEQETGEHVPWQPFAGLAIGKTEQAVIAGNDKGESNAPPE